MPARQPKDERREHYRHRRQIPTRWRDGDVYQHINNVVYYEFFDTAINGYLIECGGLDYRGGETVGFAVETHCQFLKPIHFPQTIEVCLRVSRIGNSSVRYEIGIFQPGETAPSAIGYFVHVFVSRRTQQPTRIDGRLRQALQALHI